MVLDDARWADGEDRGDSYEYDGDTCVKSVQIDPAHRTERNGLTTCTGEYGDKGNQTRYTYSGPGHTAETRRAFDENERLTVVTRTTDDEKTTENYTYDKSGRAASVEVKLGTKNPYVTELTPRGTLSRIDADDPLEFLPTVDVPDKD